MNYLTSTSTVLEIAMSLMKATGRYVYPRIITSKGKKTYHSTLTKCILSIASSPHTLDEVREKIKGIGLDGKHEYMGNIFNKKRSENLYHALAIDQALDIVNTLEARFLTSSYDKEPRDYKTISATDNGPDDLF